MSKDRRKRRGPALPNRPLATPPPEAPDAATTIVMGAPTRRAERARAKQIKRRKLGLTGGAAAALAVVLVATGVFAFAKQQNKDKPGETRTQRTLLLEVADARGAMTVGALLAYDKSAKTGAVVLLPSRVIAEVPGRGTAPFGQALSLGGPRASQDALADLMGITVDGSWVLTRAALASLVDQLGGVQVDVDTDVLADAAGGTKVVIVRAGAQRLAGTGAVAYATYLASGEGELARLPRLQAVIDGIAAAAKVKGQAAVVAAVSGLGSGAQLNRPPSEVAELLVGLPDAEVTADSLPVHEIDTGGATAYGVDPEALRTLVDNALADSVPASARGTNNRVLVQNGVGTPGVGESVRGKLDKAGFRYRAGGNVPGFTFRGKPSVVLIKDGTQESITAGQRVASALGLPVSAVQTDPRGQSVADIIVIIGADYRP